MTKGLKWRKDREVRRMENCLEKWWFLNLLEKRIGELGEKPNLKS